MSREEERKRKRRERKKRTEERKEGYNRSTDWDGASQDGENMASNRRGRR